MNEITLPSLLNMIYNSIIQNQGQGFTVELNAVVTKYETYYLKQSIWDNCTFTWKLDKKASSEKFFKCHSSGLNWHISVPEELDNKLPEGIIIKRMPPQLIKDGRADYEKRLSENKSKGFSTYISVHPNERVIYVEGRRAYLNVTDEYAYTIYKDAYQKEYNRIKKLSTIFGAKHGYIIEQIVRKSHKVFNFKSYNSNISSLVFLDVNYDNVTIESRHDGFSDTLFVIHFEDLGMKTLNLEQIPLMTIAIIETSETMYPEWKSDDIPARVIDGKITIEPRGTIFRKREAPKLSEW